MPIQQDVALASQKLILVTSAAFTDQRDFEIHSNKKYFYMLSYILKLLITLIISVSYFRKFSRLDIAFKK